MKRIYEEELIMQEADRCLQCKNPRCMNACPISTNVPLMMNLLLQDKIEEAGETLFRNNPLTSICSLVCPHERQCEGSCVLGIKGEPISIGNIEHHISKNYLENKACYKSQENKGSVAIIGSGPAGLSVAFLLAMKGYEVTIFEANEKIGGVLRYGIPEFRLPKILLEQLHVKLQQLGVRIRPNTLIGPVLSVEDLLKDNYDAVFIGTGVWNPKRLNIPGETRGNVHYAIDYLKNPQVYDLGDKVCVIGAGNVAMDAARTAVRNGVKSVTVMYRKDRKDVSATDHEVSEAEAEGVLFRFNESPKSLEERGVKYMTIDGEEKIFRVDSIIVAISQGPRDNIVSKDREINTNKFGLVVTDDFGRTTKAGVFAAGDVVTGANTVVDAVKYSKNVVVAIEAYLNK